LTQTPYEERMLSLIAEAVPARRRKAALDPELSLQRDLGLDSIAMLALLFRFEQAFEVDLSSVDVGLSIGRMRTVADALEVGRQVLARAEQADGT